jgi:hypothetical protein
MRRLWLLVLLAGCASAGVSRPQVKRTLLVENHTGTHVGVYVDGTKIGTATAGRNCIRLPGSVGFGDVNLTFSPTAWPSVSIRERLLSYEHWRVRLNSQHPSGLTYDVLSLMPVTEGC